MQQYQNVLQDKFGNVIVGASVAVFVYGTTTGATLYSGNATGLLPSNSVITNSLGEFAFYAANGRYSLSVSATNFVTQDFSDFILYDPADIGAVTATNVAFTPFGTISATNVQNAIQEVVTDLSASSGSSLVGFIQSGTTHARTVQSKERDVVSVKDFGAVGDGTTDDTAAFVAAYTAKPGATIFIPDTTASYKITALLTLPANTIFKGESRQVTKLLHAYNGDFANLGDGAGFENCWIEGQGATYTGGCFVFSGTNGRQIRNGVRVSSFDGAVESFAVAAGSQSVAVDVRYSRTAAGTGTNRFAIVISATQQLTAVPRKFMLVETDGTCAFDFGGCNNTYIVESFLGDLKYTADSRGVLISSSRIANQVALTVDGHNNTIIGCDINPQITISSGADNIAIQGNSYNTLPIIDSSGVARNLIDSWLVSYTPALTSGGTAPVLGNGTIVGSYVRTGATTTIQGELTLGSTTTLGTGGLSISLPAAKTADAFSGGTVYMNRGGTIYAGFLQIAAVASTAQLLRDTTGSVTFNSPAVFAAGDIIRWSATYRN